MDHNELDLSVEAFIAAQHSKRYRTKAPSMSSEVHGTPLWAEANDLGGHGGSFKFEFGGSIRQTAYMPYRLARDLADAINRVLMRHVADEKPAHERVRDIVVDNEMPF